MEVLDLQQHATPVVDARTILSVTAGQFSHTALDG